MYAAPQTKSTTQQSKAQYKASVQRKTETVDSQPWQPMPSHYSFDLPASANTPIQRMEGAGASKQPAMPNRTGLPDTMKTNLESMSGFDMSDVRVHYNSPKPASIGALAYTQGNQIYMGPGQNKHLGHEAWHVVQQKQGRVKATTQFKGMVGNDDAGLEKEADFYGGKIVTSQLSSVLLQPVSHQHTMPSRSTASRETSKSTLVQRIQDARTQTLIQAKIGEEENVIFGLDGKNSESIVKAIDIGYRVFDGADTYTHGGKNTILLLADAVKEKGLNREDFEIIYKVDATKPEELCDHIETVAEIFSGYIDHVIIHKVTDETQAALYLPELQGLKTKTKIKKIGAGDIKTSQENYFSMDSFEIDAINLFRGDDHEGLIKKLNETKKPIFVYNIVSALKSILGLEDNPNSDHLKAMVAKIKALVPKAEPILSSSNQERQKSNKNVYDMKYTEGEKQAYELLEDKINLQGKEILPITLMPNDVKQKMQGILFSEHNWSAEKLFDTDEDYEKAINAHLEYFTQDELGVNYQGVGDYQSKHYSLKDLINMLFHKEGNCKRVEASGFLSGAY